MSDQKPTKTAGPSFEIPDLEVESVLRSRPHAPVGPAATPPSPSAPRSFDEDSLGAGSLSLDLDPAPRPFAPVFGAQITFEDPASFELAPPAEPSWELTHNGEPPLHHPPAPGAPAAWPTGRALDPAKLSIDPVEITRVADYGVAPQAIQQTPAYAYRVFTRRRELTRALHVLDAECKRAEFEREATLADLARALRPAIEQVLHLRPRLLPLLELERVASERGQALSSISARLSEQSAECDAELSRIGEHRSAELERERDAERSRDDREAAVLRTRAKLQRVHIEIRGITQLAQQKLGPEGGQLPEAEARELSLLEQKAALIAPELAFAEAELERANSLLAQGRARLAALQQTEQQTAKKKRAQSEQYQSELQAKTRDLMESESQERAALADLGRAVLEANGGAVAVPGLWLERVTRTTERADELGRRRELLRRAIESYDAVRVADGVRLACTAILLLVGLIALKLIFRG